jgi:hypothetical protein
MMEAGRVLDTLIAEKVFGLVMLDRFTGAATPITSGVALQYLDAMNRVPHYSTEINDAWDVAAKIKFWQPNPEAFGLEKGHLQKFTVEYTGFGWRAGWAPINLDGNMTVEAEAETPQHAICLAALAALEAK